MEFSSIPYESLLQILEHVDDDELYILPHLCRRLNHLATPILLRRQGITITNMKVGAVRLTLPDQRRTLAALRTAFFVTSIAWFSCEFRPRDRDAPGAFSSDLREVVNLITRPIPLGFRVLEVDFWGSYTLTSPSEEEHLCEELFTHSNSCQTLSVRDENGDTRLYSRAIMTSRSHAPPSNPRQMLTSMGRTRASGKSHLFSHLDPSFYRGYSHFKARHPSYTLHTYRLNHHQQLLPENLQRTLSALKTVGTLELPFSGLWGTVWSDILPRIGAAARELKTVDINPTGMFVYDIIKFLSTLPKITHLTIRLPTDPRGYHDKQSAVSIHPKLPLLTSMTAPLGYLPALVAGNLPRLQFLHITLPVYRSTIFSLNSQKILAEIVARLKQRERRSFPEICLHVYMADVHAMSLDLDDFFRSGVGGGSGSPYPAITSLAITGMIPLSARPEHEVLVLVLAQWLRRFPSAREVSFLGVGQMEPSVYPIYPILYAIHTQSPNIQTVVLLANTYDVVTTLSEHEHAAVPATQPSTRKLSDLNEDIFYLIFEYFETRELYPLFTISRNFRAWVLPVYLWRRGYQNTTTSIAVSLTEYSMMEPLTDLSALTLSSIESTSSLSCRITFTAKLFFVFEFLRRLLRFIRKLSAIGNMTLNLGFRLNNAMSEPATTERAKFVWTELLVSILNAIAEKSKTFSITERGVIGGLTLPHLGNIIGQGSGLPIFTVPSPMKHTLTGLEIRSDVMQVAVLREWITALLKDNKTITHLSLTGLTSLEISSIQEATNSFPMLTDLKIDGYNILPEDVLYLLTRFPLLTSLSLEDCNWRDLNTMRPGPVIGRNPRLPQLRDLAAPPEYVAFFLQRLDALPALENLKVTMLPYSDWATTFVDDTLRTLRSLNNTIDRLHSRSRFPTLSFAMVIPYIDSQELTDEGWEAAARSTTALHIEIATGWDTLNIIHTTDILRRLLRPWVGLQHLVFVGIRWENLESLKRIIVNLKLSELCPNVRTVVAHEPGGTVHDLSSLRAIGGNSAMASGS